MKLPWDKQYLKISFHVIFTMWVIIVLSLFIYFINDIWEIFSNTVSSIIKILNPLIIGIVIAYIIDPLVEWYQKILSKININFKILKNKSTKPLKATNNRGISTILAYGTILAFLIVCVMLFTYNISSQLTLNSSNDIEELVEMGNRYLNSLDSTIDDIGNMLDKYNIESAQVKEYITSITNNIGKSIFDIGNKVLIFFKNITGYLTTLFLAIIISIYFILDKERFLNYVKIFSKAIFPKRINSKLTNFWKDLDIILSGFIRGQLIDAIIMSFVLSITLSLIKIKFAIIIGIVAGIANLIPYFGPLVAYVGGIGMALLTGEPKKALIAFIALFIVQQIDGSIIGPRLLGNGVQLHPVFVLLSIIIGGSLYGLLGMLLAVPITAVLKIFIKKFVNSRIETAEN